MRERKRCDISDGICWYCTRCKTTKSIRESSFFTKSRITLKKWMLIMYWWAKQYPVGAAKDEADVDEHTAIDVYQWLREVCSGRLMHDPPIVLGGQGTILQIDESLFRHKPKIIVLLVFLVLISLHLFVFSIIVGEQQQVKYGCLVLWIHHISLPWAIWRLFQLGMQPLYCPLYRHTPHLEV